MSLAKSSLKNMDVMISSTSKQGGYGIYRQPWAKDKLDLSRLNGHEKLKFAHKNGYYAVTHPNADDADLIAMIALATLPH